MKADKCGQEISQQPLKRAFATSGLYLPPHVDELMDNNRPGRLPEIEVSHTGTGLVSVSPHSIQFADQNLVNAALRIRARSHTADQHPQDNPGIQIPWV